MKLYQIVAAVALSALCVHAQLAEYCPLTEVCYRLNIPETTAQSGSGDIYFQLSGPSSYSWIGLGQGSSMAGANMFVVYTDGTGNVTGSPRLGQGHFEPQYSPSANVTLLEGSGVREGRAVANVRCSNCDTWTGGGMDFSGSNGDWIFAYRPGDPLDSESLAETIGRHEGHGAFT